MRGRRSTWGSTETGRDRPLCVRPRFIATMVALRYVGAVFLGGALGGFGGVLVAFATEREPGVVLPAAVALGALLVWLLFVLGTARYYARTEYRLYDDRIEYEKGFLGREHKELPWSWVTECTLRQGVLQQMYGVGTIVLATPATDPTDPTDPTGSAVGSGMKIVDVPDPEWVYAQVRARVHAARQPQHEGLAPA
ncbi:MAG: hypothetical protein KatS3mg102_0705 [Planctomycetota bacterium]|nr:MAG: hypothetical protein KatS3mg102_0705 [Planctomycetota bacterium]